MNNFIEIKPEELKENPFQLIGKDWGLVTVNAKDKVNMMTISWGGVGIMWNKPVCVAVIRPQRYTSEFVKDSQRLTLSFLEDGNKEALKICGTKSGRDYDKPKKTGLTPAFTEDGIPYFEQARLVLVCKKMYSQFLTEENVIDGEGVKKWYKDDYHKMYVSEITKVLVK